jgi:acyl carrier protein
MGLTPGQIESDLAAVFHQVLDEDVVLRRDLTADQVEGWDSLAHVRLLLTVEKKFQVKIGAQEASRLKSVGDLMDLLEKKLEARGA